MGLVVGFAFRVQCQYDVVERLYSFWWSVPLSAWSNEGGRDVRMEKEGGERTTINIVGVDNKMMIDLDS